MHIRSVVWQHLLLVLAALIGGIALLLDKSPLMLTNNKPYMGFDVVHVQRVYAQKEARLLKAMSEIDNYLSANPKAVPAVFFTQFGFGSLTPQGLFLLIYQHDSLVYWSDNSVPVSVSFSESLLDNNTIILANGFYTIYKREAAGRIVVGLMRIRHNYEQENNFLQSDYQADFELTPSISISTIDFSDDSRIFDYKHKFLFSLVPKYIARSDKPFYYTSVSLYFLAFVLLIVYLDKLINILYRYRQSVFWLIPFAIIWGLLRWWMLSEKVPKALYASDLFNPEIYGESFWAASLGDLMINNVLLLYLAFKFHNYVNTANFINRLKSLPKGIWHILLKLFYAGFVLGFFWFSANRIVSILTGLVINSKISFEVYQILEVRPFTVLAYIIAGISLAALLILTDKLAEVLQSIVSWWVNLILLILSMGLQLVYSWTLHHSQSYFVSVILALLLATLLFSKFFYRRYRYQIYTAIVVLNAGLTVLVVSNAMTRKDHDRRMAMVRDIAAERDLVAETLFKELAPRIANDEFIRETLFASPRFDTKELYKHLQAKYFGGYLSKYDLRFSTCSDVDTLLYKGQRTGCYAHYREIIGFYGDLLGPSNFYFLNNQNGRINYLGWIRFPKSDSSNEEVSLFLEFESKMHDEQLGYPELLLEGSLVENNELVNYNYAKYKDGRLISQSGEYPYKLNQAEYQFTKTEYSFVDLNGFNHLIYQPDAQTTIMLSKPKASWLDYLVFFAYLFASYYLFLLVAILIIRLSKHRGTRQFFLKNRIQVSMISMLSVSMLLIGGATIYFNMVQFEKKQLDYIREKIQSVQNELHIYLSVEQELYFNWHTEERFKNLDELLNQLAHVFLSDIHLYDLKGNLLASSRNVIFDKGLQGMKMNSEAYKELIINERASFTHNEQIGRLEFLSAYVPLKNLDNTPIAYINVPYFSRQTELKRELSTLVVALINVYVILILLSIFITLLISNKITEPLKLVQESLRDMKLGAHNTISYKSHDEIGDLVKEYNTKVTELAESARKLAASEREGAWREMAKQVAHEIKNPLTPMKLSIQLLLRSWRDQDPKFEKRFEKTANTLTEQIDRLTSIATEFSNFAKMPKPEPIVFNLVAEVRKTVELFDSSERASFDFYPGNEEVVDIFADEKQISRVLINLVKNAVQAIPKHHDGHIIVTVQTTNEIVLVSITDNGTGIPEELRPKIFWPNFTTKSSGTGVGLYIVQNILRAANGRIWFETELDKGTSFFVELPRYDANAPILAAVETSPETGLEA